MVALASAVLSAVCVSAVPEPLLNFADLNVPRRNARQTSAPLPEDPCPTSIPLNVKGHSLTKITGTLLRTRTLPYLR